MIYIQSDFKNENGEIKGGMFVSNDRGKNWTQINNGLLKNLANNRVPGFIAGLAVCETKPETAYISTINPVPNEKGATEEVYCIFKTINGGSSGTGAYVFHTEGIYNKKFQRYMDGTQL